jgi:hypothetical protein
LRNCVNLLSSTEMGNRGKHSVDPRPYFLVEDHVPVGRNVTTTRPISNAGVRTVKIRNIHFKDGSNIRFYVTEPRPVPDAVRLALRNTAKKKFKKVLEENLKSTKLRLKRRFRARPKKV